MIPARDKEEFELFPQEDRDFIRHWVNWTDVNVAYLKNTAPIPSLPGPGLGNVDGTTAMYEGEGFIFLYNPNLRVMNTSLVVRLSFSLFPTSSTFARLAHQCWHS
eukprot:SAG31_NODE_2021_length_6647_cov_2.271839_4_plen_105_part_00